MRVQNPKEANIKGQKQKSTVKNNHNGNYEFQIKRCKGQNVQFYKKKNKTGKTPCVQC